MKTMRKIFGTMMILLATVLALSSCRSEEGKIGERGPKGEQGEQGAQGPQGPRGAEGNANVKVYTKNIEGATWTKVGATMGYLTLKVDAPTVLTKDVVDNWTVLVYVNSSDFNQSGWALLPYYTERNIRVTADIYTGYFILKRDQDGKPNTQSWFNKVKLVLIKPSSSGTISSRQGAPLPDYKNYSAVIKYYGLPEEEGK